MALTNNVPTILIDSHAPIRSDLMVESNKLWFKVGRNKDGQVLKS